MEIHSKSTAIILILLVTFSSLGLSKTKFAIAQQASSDWPMFHANLSHNGVGEGSPVLTPTLLWKFNTGGGVYSSAAVVNGVVYVGSTDQYFFALNAADGKQIWNYITPNSTSPGVFSSAAVLNGVVYVGGGSVVYAFNASNGAVLWQYSNGGTQPIESSPAVANGIVFIGSSDTPRGGYITALNASTGALVWSYNVRGAVASSPAVVNDVVYVGNPPSLYAFNATTGAVLWDYASAATGSSAPTVVNGVLYVGSTWSDSVDAFDASNGAEIWNYSTSVDVGSSPAVADGVVYVGSAGNSLAALNEGKVYALNATNGNKIWSFTPLINSGENAVFSSPAVVDGVVFVGSFNGNVYALNASNGAELWNYATGNIVFSSPAVADGVIYIGSNDGNLYALKDFTSVSSPTPTSTHSIPELPWLVIAPLLLSVFSVAVLVRHRKTAN